MIYGEDPDISLSQDVGSEIGPMERPVIIREDEREGAPQFMMATQWDLFLWKTHGMIYFIYPGWLCQNSYMKMAIYSPQYFPLKIPWFSIALC